MLWLIFCTRQFWVMVAPPTGDLVTVATCPWRMARITGNAAAEFGTASTVIPCTRNAGWAYLAVCQSARETASCCDMVVMVCCKADRAKYDSTDAKSVSVEVRRLFGP